MSTSFDIKSNKCEICNQVASAGVLDERQEGKIRYTCKDHYMQLYEKIRNDLKR
jgi:hypothetical protein